MENVISISLEKEDVELIQKVLSVESESLIEGKVKEKLKELAKKFHLSLIDFEKELNKLN